MSIIRTSTLNNVKKRYIVYDGECPFCSRFVKMLRLKEAMGSIELIDARSDESIVKTLTALNIDLDEGMALVDSGIIYHGDDCMNRLALMSTRSGLFNKLNYHVFKSRTISMVLYPILRAGRNLVLSILGRRKIGERD